jgi:hypothetical protein
MRIKKTSGETFELAADRCCTIGDVQAEVMDHFGIPPQHQVLIFRNNKVSAGPDKTLAEFGITDADEIIVRAHVKGTDSLLFLFFFI